MAETADHGGIIDAAEDERFEAKSCRQGIPESLWETYSAFANTRGGVIVLGVGEEDGALIPLGLKRPDVVRDQLWNTLNNPQKVSYNTLMADDISIQEVEGVQVVVMDVPAASRDRRPVYIANMDGGTYVRRGSTDHKCDSEGIAAMIRDASMLSKDMDPARYSTVGDFDPGSVKAYRNMFESRHPTSFWNAVDLNEFLKLIGAARVVDGELIPTIAGVMMFGRTDTMAYEVPRMSLDYREYEAGGDKWTLRRLSGEPEWSGNLFDFYTYVTNRISLQTPKGFSVPDGMNRVDDTEMIRALREVVTNCVAHADHWTGGGVVMEWRPDSFTARNPGTFRIPIEDAVHGGRSDPRNEAVFRMLNLIGMSGAEGTGIRRVREVCLRNGLPEPEITASRAPDSVTVTLRFGIRRRPETITGVLELIDSGSRMTIVEMSKELGIPKSRVESEISALKAEGIIERIGGPRGRWVVRRRDYGIRD